VSVRCGSAGTVCATTADGIASKIDVPAKSKARRDRKVV
jgi:hypothetical protein